MDEQPAIGIGQAWLSFAIARPLPYASGPVPKHRLVRTFDPMLLQTQPRDDALVLRNDFTSI